ARFWGCPCRPRYGDRFPLGDNEHEPYVAGGSESNARGALFADALELLRVGDDLGRIDACRFHAQIRQVQVAPTMAGAPSLLAFAVAGTPRGWRFWRGVATGIGNIGIMPTGIGNTGIGNIVSGWHGFENALEGQLQLVFRNALRRVERP